MAILNGNTEEKQISYHQEKSYVPLNDKFSHSANGYLDCDRSMGSITHFITDNWKQSGIHWAAKNEAIYKIGV